MMSTRSVNSSIHSLSQRYSEAHDEAEVGAIQAEIERELAVVPPNQMFSLLVTAAEGGFPGLLRKSD